MSIKIYPYKMFSEGAKSLAESLACLLIKPDGKYKPKKEDIVINWGNSSPPLWDQTIPTWMNHPSKVEIASNKLKTFKLFTDANVPCPEWTTDKEKAKEWLTGSDLVVRTLLNSHSGKGIILVKKGDTNIPDALLYTKYFKKAKEYRVHVFGEDVIDTQEKRRATGWKDNNKFNSQIRSHDNGWVFCREDILPSEVRDKLAIKAIKSLGLSFGAVDIIYNESKDAYKILEVNTAPGLEGQTIDSYATAILQGTE